MSYPGGTVAVMGEDRLLALAGCRPWAMSAEELVAALDLVHAVRVEAEALTLRLLRQLDLRKAASAVSASSAAVWYRNRHRVAIRSTHRWVRVAKRIDAAPEVVGAGVESGAVNLDQADVVTRALARIPREVGVDIRELTASKLVELCAELDPEQLKHVGDRILSLVAPEVADELDRKALEHAEALARRERYFTMTPDGVGVRLSGRLTADGAAAVRAAIDPLCAPTPHDQRSPEQRRADALVDVCRLALATTDLPENGGERPQIVVGIDFDAIRQQLGAGTSDNGDRITPEAARRMACDAGLVPMLLNGRSQPLDVGRSRRSVPGPLRRAWTPTDFRPSSHPHTSISSSDPNGTATTRGSELRRHRSTRLSRFAGSSASSVGSLRDGGCRRARRVFTNEPRSQGCDRAAGVRGVRARRRPDDSGPAHR
jgi:hypothetical protein